MKFRFLILAVLIWPAVGGASSWQSTEPSTLRFEGAAQGESFTGEFKQFTARIDFDPEALASTRFEVEIALASADSQNAERDELLRGEEFFAVDNQANARFVAVGAEPTADGYLSRGTLTLKGISRTVNFRFRFTSGDEAAQLEGEAQLDRTDFAVGSGEWEDADTIDHAVKVNTSLRLIPATAAP